MNKPHQLKKVKIIAAKDVRRLSQTTPSPLEKGQGKSKVDDGVECTSRRTAAEQPKARRRTKGLQDQN